MADEEKIREYLNEKELKEKVDFFIVDVLTGNKIKVFVDNMQGISIQECVQISRFLDGKLNEEGVNLHMEVSSPGIDMPLKVDEQFTKTTGKQISVKFTDGTRRAGKLIGTKNKTVEIEFEEVVTIPGEKKKRKQMKVETFDRREIIEIKRNISF